MNWEVTQLDRLRVSSKAPTSPLNSWLFLRHLAVYVLFLSFFGCKEQLVFLVLPRRREALFFGFVLFPSCVHTGGASSLFQKFVWLRSLSTASLIPRTRTEIGSRFVPFFGWLRFSDVYNDLHAADEEEIKNFYPQAWTSLTQITPTIVLCSCHLKQ